MNRLTTPEHPAGMEKGVLDCLLEKLLAGKVITPTGRTDLSRVVTLGTWRTPRCSICTSSARRKGSPVERPSTMTDCRPDSGTQATRYGRRLRSRPTPSTATALVRVAAGMG